MDVGESMVFNRYKILDFKENAPPTVQEWKMFWNVYSVNL